MPIVLLKHIYYVSSEDKDYPASNLLGTVNKKWKCKENGEKSIAIIFELDEPTIITGIDIGNEHSAYVQVLVNKKGGKDSDYEELLLTSSFMTPLESRNSTNPNRVRCFSENTLVGDVAEKKWNLVKVICTQPYNKHVQYGLSFIKLHGSGPGVSDSQSSNSSAGSRIVQLGKFKMREESPDTSDSDSLTSTSLFSRWKNTNSTSLVNKETTATEIKKASTSFASASPSFINRNKISDKKNTSISLPDGDDVAEVKGSKKARNMNRLFYDDDEEVSNERLEKKLEKDKLVKEKEKLEREKLQKHKKDDKQPTEPQHNRRTGDEKMKNSMSKFKTFLDEKDKDPEPSTSTTVSSKPSASPSVNKPTTSSSPSKESRTPKRRSSPPPQDNQPQETKKPKLSTERPKIYKPFKKLMEGVIFTISGIQNPERADLRKKATDMGARYKPDWDKDCTHLICAFKGTPKYNQVKQENGKIVDKKWIHDSHSKRMKYPWRRYALDSYDHKLQDSDEEIYDEKFAAKKTDVIVPTSQTSETDTNILDMYDKSPEYDSGEDTEEEIERVKKESASVRPKGKPTNNIGDHYDLSTDDELHINSQSNQTNRAFFKGLKFHLNTKTLSSTELIKLKHLIKVYQGELCEDESKSDFIISNKSINKPDRFEGEIIKPLWILESHDMESKLPIKRYTFDS